eukprot:UN11946
MVLDGNYACVLRVILKSFSLAILVSLTNIFKISLECKTKHILQLFTVRNFLETRLTFNLFLSFRKIGLCGFDCENA